MVTNNSKKIEFDFGLLDINLELDSLYDLLKAIEKQLIHLEETERDILNTDIKEQNLSGTDPEWYEENTVFDNKIELLYPRFLNGSFLITLYAVYESAVTEIAKLIQKKMEQGISIGDLRGNFVERSKKYYKHILKFELCKDIEYLSKITILSEIRHALAHTNGRIDMVRPRMQEKIKGWAGSKIGIEIVEGFIIVNSSYLEESFRCVKETLVDLVERYKKWDSNVVQNS
ncbi:MAG: hypothetical protein P9L92_03720 [Candidatus Electryonea clarkiae]|nr:hypothetical protein [Candidatus Electryonea clarkiae]MDP8288750.1 hypothetical protein [Candidatus Electryonea clarkiae]